MEIFLIIVGIWALYWRTLKNSCWLIDDMVPRQGYLYIIPEMSPPPQYYSTKRHWIHGALLLLIHSINVWIVYLIWGWLPATLFAFSPLSVPGAAWSTGGYYAVTTLFTLTAYFFLTHFPGLVGAGLAAIFFATALGSTITCLGFPFLFLIFNHWGLILFWPVLAYLTGRRFTAGYKIRDMGKSDHFSLKKIPVMIKVVAYYIYTAVFPYRLSFFKQFGEDYVRSPEERQRLEARDGWFYLSLLSIFVFILVGWMFSPLGVVWFLCLIAPFCQFKVLGQFVAERYIYLPSIGWYVILGNALAPYPILLCLVVALYLLRSHFYIPTYANMENLYADGIRNEPKCMANYANLGERFIHMGRLLDGKNMLARGLEIDPTNFLCYTNTAAYWVQVKDMQKAIYYTQKSIDAADTKSSWNIKYAMIEQMKSIMGYEKHINHLIYGYRDLALTKVPSEDGSVIWGIN